MGVIVIKKGREKPIIQQHPWIFSGAIARVDGQPANGDIVTVVSERGDFLARGYWNVKSQIQVRILTWHDETIDEDWWRQSIQRAYDARGVYNAIQHDRGIGYRLIHAESDYLPGLTVDRYGDFLVMQAGTLAIDQRKTMLAGLLAEITGVKGIFERSDVDIRGKEGLKPSVGVLWGEAPPETLWIQERRTPLDMAVDVRQGHKTGFYLDQAENRALLHQLITEDYPMPDGECRVLNTFCYTGTFSLAAMDANPIVTTVNVDASMEALTTAERNFQRAGIPESRYELLQADVFDYLRDIVASREQYDIVILDPPKFAHNAQQVDKAARGYKDINMSAFKIIKPGGYLMTYSCSGAISRDLFQKIVFGALADSGRQAQIVRMLGAGDDHPIALTFPEGEYLKGLLLRVY